MPTVADLERLQGLVRRLTPLTTAQGGELILAQSWNVVVNALIEIARAVLTQERSNGLVARHEHTDQVTVSWLDPRLRSLIERGPLSDPAAEEKVAELGRNTKRLSSRADEFLASFNEIRSQLLDFSTRDLTREALLTALGRKVEGISDGRDDVLALRRTLETIRRDVDTAIEIASHLRVDGQIVDIAALLARIKLLEELRTRLIRPSGELFDAAAFEMQLQELTNSLVTEEELTGALNDRLGNFTPGLLEGIEENLRTVLNNDADDKLKKLTEELHNEIARRLSEIDAIVDRAIADELVPFREQILSTIRPEINSAVQESQQATLALFEKRLAEYDATLRQDINRQLEELKKSLHESFMREVEQRLSDRLAPIQEELARLSERMKRAEAQLKDHEGRIAKLESGLQQAQQQTNTALAQMRHALVLEIKRSEKALMKEIEKCCADNDRINQVRIDNAVADARKALLAEAQTSAAEAAAVEGRLIQNRLRGEMRQIAKDEVAALNDRIRELAAKEIQNAFTSVPGMISREVLRATANLPEIVQAEFHAFQTTIRPLVEQALTAFRPGLIEEITRRVLEAIRNNQMPPAAATGDDFTPIKGIGPAFEKRLKDSGVKTFAELAALTPEQVAEILGITAQRVVRENFIGQARRLSLI